jgi:hypothetical protein
VPKKKDERHPADDGSFPEGPILPLDASLASTALSTLLPQDASVFTTATEHIPIPIFKAIDPQ